MAGARTPSPWRASMRASVAPTMPASGHRSTVCRASRSSCGPGRVVVLAGCVADEGEDVSECERLRCPSGELDGAFGGGGSLIGVGCGASEDGVGDRQLRRLGDAVAAGVFQARRRVFGRGGRLPDSISTTAARPGATVNA